MAVQKIPPGAYPTLAARVAAGESLAAVGQAYGVTRQAIYRILAKHDPETLAAAAQRRGDPPLKKAKTLTRDVLAGLVADRVSDVEIGRRYGLDPQTVRRRRRRWDIRRGNDLAAVQRIWQLHDEGVGRKRTARTLNVEGYQSFRGDRWHPTTVARILQRPRPPKPTPPPSSPVPSSGV